MLQAERVANFVRSELSQTGEDNLLHELRHLGIIAAVRCQQSGGDQKILTVPQRTETHATLDDFPGSRVDNRSPIRPAAGRAMHPLNYVVPNIHWISIDRHHLNAKSVSVPGSFKRLVPPTCAFD